MFKESHLRRKLRDHMTAKRDLVITKVPLGLDGTHRPSAIDDEAIQLRFLLESLLAAP